MLNLEGFYPVSKKRCPGNYGLKYRTTRLASGSIEYCFLFSKNTMEEQGWICGDYISIAYDSDEEVVGFAKAVKGDPFIRKLRRKDATRAGCIVTLCGDFGLPEVSGSTEVEIVTDEYELTEQSLLVRLPSQTEGGA